MSTHLINLSWTRTTPDFSTKTFDRTHTILFSGGDSLETSSAPNFLGNPKLANPEELLVAALSSCFMLTFLYLAASQNIIVDSYEDQAEGTLGKNEAGKTAVTKVILHPNIVFTPETHPTSETLHSLLEKAHAGCFISNSVKTVVHIEPVFSDN